MHIKIIQMEFLSVGLLLLFSFIIIVLLIKKRKTEQKFKQKLKLLELLIVELNNGLKIQNQKVELSEDLKAKIKQSNVKLSKFILEMNLELFDDLYSKNQSV